MESFEGEVNGKRYNKEKYKDWKENTNNVLRKREIPYQVVNKNGYIFIQFFAVLFFICLIGEGIFFLYLVNDGKLQSLIDQPIQINNSINPETNNQYEFKPETKNYFNNTFQLNLDSEAIKRLCNNS